MPQQRTYNVTRNQCWRGKAISVTYCVSAVVVIQHAKRLNRIQSVWSDWLSLCFHIIS